MGKLAGRIKDINRIQQKLATVDRSEDVRRGELDTLLDSRFDKVSDRLNGALDRLMAESDAVQSKSLKKAVDGVVRAVSDTHGIFKQGLQQISEEVALSHNVLTDKLAEIEIDGSLADRITDVGKTLSKLPTSFPKQKDVDLSAVMFGMKELAKATPDIGPQIASLEKRLSNRIYEFKVERDPFNDLIEKIVVTEQQ
jgi:hypothetical protein